MAYENSSVANLDSLLQAIVNFAVANAGFTEHTKLTVSGRPSDMYIIQKGSIYWWFLGRLNPTLASNYGDWGVIEARMMTTMPTVANRDTQNLGQRYSTKIMLYSRYNGPFQEYNLYSNPDGDAVHMALEIFPNIFTHMSFGSLNKFGVWAGGEYITGNTGSITNTIYNVSLYGGFSQPNTYTQSGQGLYMSHGGGPNSSTVVGSGYIHAPNSPADNTFTDFSPMSSSILDARRSVAPVLRNTVSLSGESLISDLQIFGSNDFNSRAALLPTYYQLYYDTSFHNGNNRYAIIGRADDVRIINIERINPKETVNDNWDTYPQIQKAGDELIAPISAIRGIAYKRFE